MVKMIHTPGEGADVAENTVRIAAVSPKKEVGLHAGIHTLSSMPPVKTCACACTLHTHACSGQVNSSRLHLPFITAIGEEASQGAEEKERQRRRAEHRNVLHEENSSLLGGLFFLFFVMPPTGTHNVRIILTYTYVRVSSLAARTASSASRNKISRNGQNDMA